MRGTTFTQLGVAFGLALLASCGGGDDTIATRQAFIEAAHAKEAEARRLGVATPCDHSAQCGVLRFMSPIDQCPVLTYAVYSTVSTTAGAASAAAAEQASQARRAQELYSGPPVVCTGVVAVEPTPTCTAAHCQTARQ